jgi:endonuclease I
MPKKCWIIALFLLGITLAGATYTVSFEGTGETKFAYASGTVTLSGLAWDLTEVLIGTDAADWKNGLRAARLRGYGASAMTMLANKANGLGSITFQYRRYGTDAQVDWKAEYSTNDGASWYPIGSSFTAPASDVVQTFSHVVNVTGAVRVRIKRATESGSSNRRLNIDDIVLTDYSGGGEPILAPTLQATDIVTYPAVNEIALEWTPGNGSYRVVKINTTNSFTVPDNGSNPAANSVYSGSGEQVIYNGATEFIEGSPFNGCSASGLTQQTDYWFRIYEYNGTGLQTMYLGTTATGNPVMASTTTQTGTGYYAGISGYGSSIKGQLHTLIKNTHSVQYTYDAAKIQLYYTDEDPANSNNVIEIYTGWSINKSSFGSLGAQWNREHTWSKSHGDFGDVRPAGTDLHHLRPCDASINSTKSNKDFDDGGSAVNDNSPPPGYDAYTGCFTTTDTWEPRTEDKGDVARIIMYMAVRYDGDDSNFSTDLEIVDHVYSDAGQNLPYYGKLSTLLQWHYQDPPDEWEERRNARIAERQGNRNPFIDHPEYAQYIWTPVPTYITNVSQTGFTAHWSVPVDATSYWLQVATDSLFTDHVTGYANYNAGTASSKALSGLSNASTYYYRLRSYFESGYSMYSPFLRVELLPDPIAGLASAVPLYEYYLDQQEISITLANCSFTDNQLSPANFILLNAPSGLGVASVIYTSSQSASLVLSFNGMDFDTNTQLGVIIAGSELNTGTNLTSNYVLVKAFVETLVSIDKAAGTVVLNITPVANASEYFIFSSSGPYGDFQDSSPEGSFDPVIQTQWSIAPGIHTKRFFRAAATVF